MSVRSSTDLASDAEALGHYELGPAISLGDFTAVHRARQSGPRSRGGVVVKRLRHGAASTPECRELFLNAGRLGLALESPYLTRTVAVLEQPEPLVVLEPVSGANLQRLLMTASRHNVARFVMPIIVDALRGLHALHEFGGGSQAGSRYVHGAPYARHILVGNDGRARLADLTHAVGPGLAWSAWRQNRIDPAEMAPEQALAPTSVDARCDVFIVGAVLWHALTGKSLFRRDTVDETVRAVLRGGSEPPSRAGAQVDRAIDAICLKALHRSRTERFASAAEMAHVLEEAAVQAGHFASPDEVGEWVGAQSGEGSRRVLSASAGSSSRHTMLGIGPGAAAASLKMVSSVAPRSLSSAPPRAFEEHDDDDALVRDSGLFFRAKRGLRSLAAIAAGAAAMGALASATGWLDQPVIAAASGQTDSEQAWQPDPELDEALDPQASAALDALDPSLALGTARYDTPSNEGADLPVAVKPAQSAEASAPAPLAPAAALVAAVRQPVFARASGAPGAARAHNELAPGPRVQLVPARASSVPNDEALPENPY